MDTTFNVTLDCEKYHSYKDFYLDLKALNESLLHNETFILSRCPELCQAIYGSGNPDLAGIGVSVDRQTIDLLAFLHSFSADHPRLINRLSYHTQYN